ncbi:MAG: extracellular solute-binding protein [Spirochaetaceae bacterium]
MKRNSIMLMMCFFIVGSSAIFAGAQNEKASTESEIPVLEVWWAAANNKMAETMDEPNVYQQRVIDAIGIGYEKPNVPWGGSRDYAEKLKLRLVAGDAPDIMRLPNSGFSIPELIDGGVAVDITELLPKYAPTVYAAIPDDIKQVVKYESSNKDKMYFIPVIRTAANHGAFIRKDWLKRVGLDMPKTEEDFFNVLRAFKVQDANGNGDPNDEIPTSGRGPGRWWDHLFTPFGVAMIEGFPTWDVYDGKVQYSGVQPEMRRALETLSKAYAEGLIDPEVLLNKPSVWEGKIFNDQVGIHFHMPIFLGGKIPKLYPNYPEAEWAWLPPFKVSGVDAKWSKGYVSSQNTNEKVVFTGDEETVINALKLLEYLQTPEVTKANIDGIEGHSYNIVNGKMVVIPKTEQGDEINSWVQDVPVRTTEIFKYATLKSVNEMDAGILQTRAADTMKNVYNDAKIISTVGPNLPSAIYDGFPDISSHQLYFSMMAKILIGEKPIEYFDDFVKKWYATGGDEVTKLAQKAAADLGL